MVKAIRLKLIVFENFLLLKASGGGKVAPVQLNCCTFYQVRDVIVASFFVKEFVWLRIPTT